MAEQVSGLVQHRNVLVLVDDGHFGLVLLLFGRLLCGGLGPLRREKLIVDVQLNEVFRGSFFAVDLDPLVAEAFVEQAGGEIAGHALDKAGEADALIVGGGSVLFHEFGSFIFRDEMVFLIFIQL